MERIKSVSWEYEDGRTAHVAGEGHVRIVTTQVTEEFWDKPEDKRPRERKRSSRYLTIGMPMPAEE